MRPLAVALAWLALPTVLVGQAPDSAAKPERVTKGHVSVTCKYGAAGTKPVGVALTFGKDIRFAAIEVPRAIQDAGFALLPTVPAAYETRPFAQWPDTAAADPYRTFPHPGVVASLVLGRGQNDSVMVFGSVDALCSPGAGAPDSTVAIALDLARARLQAYLEAHRPH